MNKTAEVSNRQQVDLNPRLTVKHSNFRATAPHTKTEDKIGTIATRLSDMMK